MNHSQNLAHIGGSQKPRSPPVDIPREVDRRRKENQVRVTLEHVKVSARLPPHHLTHLSEQASVEGGPDAYQTREGRRAAAGAGIRAVAGAALPVDAGLQQPMLGLSVEERRCAKARHRGILPPATITVIESPCVQATRHGALTCAKVRHRGIVPPVAWRRRRQQARLEQGHNPSE
jgi:hypothetical protein